MLSLVNLPEETSSRTTLSLGVTTMQVANKSTPSDEHMNVSCEPNIFQPARKRWILVNLVCNSEDINHFKSNH